MHKLLRSSFLAATGLCLMASAALAAPVPPAEGLPDVSAADLKKIMTGEVLVHTADVGKPIRRVSIVGIIKAPPQQVWNLFIDYNHYPKIYSTVKRMDLVKVEGKHHIYKAWIGLPWPVGEKWVTTDAVLDAARRRDDWTRIEGTIKEYRGSYQVEALDAPGAPKGAWSLVRMAAEIDPGIALLPFALINFVQTYTLPSSITDLREYIKNNPKAGL